MLISSNDRWAVTQQGPPGTAAGDAVVGYAFRSAGDTSYLGPAEFTGAVITSTWTQTQDDLLGFVFEFNLAPGATKRLAYFVYRGLAEGSPGPDGCDYYGGCTTPLTGAQSTLAKNVVTALAATPPLCDLSAAARATVVNWPSLASLCRDMFLPLLAR